MSITITVRPVGTKSGGETKTLPAEGDNGNQEIDTKSEAEAALAFLKDDKSVAVVGDRDYTRAQLIAIRDANQKPAAPAPVAAPAAPANPAPQKKVSGDGISHGFGLQGSYAGGVNEHGHSGGGGRISYEIGIPLSKGATQLFLIPSLGADFGRAEKDYTAPNGEKLKSAFNHGAAVLGAQLQVIPSILDQRLLMGIGVSAVVGGFGTDAGTIVNLPPSCTPGDFGQAECEPNAGPKQGNGGLTGLYNPLSGGARATDGIIVGADIDAKVGGRVMRDSWGSVELFAGARFSHRSLVPKDGHPIDSQGVAGFGGVSVRFGGADALVATSDPQPTPPPAAPPAPTPAPAPAAFDAEVISSPAAVKAQEKFLVGVKVGSASKVRVSFKDAAGTLNNSNSVLVDEGNSKSEFGVPAELKSGKYKLIITFEDVKTGVKKVEEKDIIIVENVAAALPGSFAPGQPVTIQNAKVNGIEKLEGVTYVIEGFDKDKKSVGTLASNSLAKGDKSWTLEEKTGTRIPLSAPDGKGFKKDINYVVTLKNKEGHAVWTGSFEVGQAAVGGRKKKPR